MKDIRKALKMRYVANLSLRDISNATKLPHTTISDYCKRFDSSGYKLDELLSLSDDKISLTLFKDKQIVKKLPIKELPDVVYIHKEIAKKGVTFELLWQEYKDVNPNKHKYFIIEQMIKKR